MFFFFKQKTAYELRISDWSSDVCSSDLDGCADDHLRGVRTTVDLAGARAEAAALDGHRRERTEPDREGREQRRAGWGGELDAEVEPPGGSAHRGRQLDRKSTRLNSSH